MSMYKRHLDRSKNPRPQARHAPQAKNYSFGHLAGATMVRGLNPPDNSPGASIAARLGFKVEPLDYKRSGDAKADAAIRAGAVMGRAAASGQIPLAQALLEAGAEDSVIASALALAGEAAGSRRRY